MKKGNFNRSRLAVTLVLILLSPIIGAAENISSPVWDLFKNLSFTPPSGDLSVTLLAKMFGEVPGITQFSSFGVNIFGVIFSVFNAGILALSGVFLGYTVIKIVTETTMDGSGMGKSTTIWTAVRCALSTSLLVPQANGYSMINGIVMWVVVQSIGLADLTWNSAVDYFSKGGGVYAVASKSDIDYSLISYGLGATSGDTQNTDPASVGSADILRSLVCAYAVYGALLQSQSERHSQLLSKIKKSGSGALTASEQLQFANSSKSLQENSETFSLYKKFDAVCIKNGTGGCSGYNQGVVTFPYIQDENKNPLKEYGLNLKDNNIPTDLTGICGTVSYVVAKDGLEDTIYNKVSELYLPAKLQGLESMITALKPVAKQVFDGFKAGDTKSKLDLNRYLVYRDSSGVDRGLVKAGVSISTATLPSYTDQTISELNNITQLTQLLEINWPLGTDEMLSAALAYQNAIAPAQRNLYSFLTQSWNKSNYEEAKSKGWIAAGGFYRLLASTGDYSKKSYYKYRLMGYKDLDTPLANEMQSRNKYFALFNRVFKANSKLSTNKTSLEIIDSSSSDSLRKSLTWLYLSYPYSELRGKQVAATIPSLEKTGSQLNSPNLETSSKWYSDLISNLFGTNSSVSQLIEIYTKLGAGAALLATAAPTAIPLLAPLPMDLLKVDMNVVFATWSSEMNSEHDPIIKLRNLGDEMMNQAMTYYNQLIYYFTTIAVVLSTASLATEVSSLALAAGSFMGVTTGMQMALDTYSSMNNSMIDVVQTFVLMYLPIGLAVTVPMFVSGAIFAVYLPLVPYLLFLFGVISWFISVLILMAAAPIICFLMLWGNSSQENPLLAREAEQFIMQVLGVFFRPTLMIIGLISGMVLSYVGVDVLNVGFANLISSVVSKTNITGKAGSDLMLLKNIGVIVVYTFIMVSLVNICFSPIYLLYSEAMRIAGISAPAVGMEREHLEAVKAGTTQFAEAGGGAGMKEGAASLKGSRAQFKLGKPEPKKKDGGGGSGGGAEGSGGGPSGGEGG